jgi:hypothetical protein
MIELKNTFNRPFCCISSDICDCQVYLRALFRQNCRLGFAISCVGSEGGSEVDILTGGNQV